MSGVLKRKFAEIDEDTCSSSSSSSSSSLPPFPSSPESSEWESDVESNSVENYKLCKTVSPTALPLRSILKRPRTAQGKGSVRFDLVTVFLFPRCQGFTSVPSRGGATLGMLQKHHSLHRYTLSEHALDRRHRHREKLRERRREEKLEALRHKLIASGSIDPQEADRVIAQVPDEDIDFNDAELEDGCFLQPYPSKQRQALLKTAGVKRIDKEEKRQLHALRLSREDCGCDCQGFCDPETCACSLAGIKCQVDRFNFPCGCSKDGCGNTQGRIEFNSRRVKTHYIHTVMRLELKKRLQHETLNQRACPQELQQEPHCQGHPLPEAQGKSCPFGFIVEEDGLPLSMPPTPTFHFSSELSLAEENSCSSVMTDSSCSSGQSEESVPDGRALGNECELGEENRGLARILNLCDSESEDCSVANDNEPRHIRQPLNQPSSNPDTYALTTDTMGTLCEADEDRTHTANIGRSSVAHYLDENANQASDLFNGDPLQEYPNTPSPSIDYSSNSYMDLSLSSDSDLEFFDMDYTCGPLYNSFKGYNHHDNIHHLTLQLSSCPVQQYESSTCLLESLIG